MIGGLAAAVAGAAGIAGAAGRDFGPLLESRGGDVIFAHWGGGFMERRIGRVLEEIEATPEQEERFWKIIDDARAEIWPMLREFRGAREDIAELLGAATIDRAAVEKLRSERIAAMEQVSRRMTTALLDAAEVLTPEQRAELLEIFREHRSHRRW
jgi:Spy/CpxP family protein refolding chaperone